MKMILALGLAGGIAWLALTPTPRQRAIREHRVTLTMTQDEVRASLGEPLSMTTPQAHEEVWTYSDRIVTFGHGKMIDSSPITHPVVAADPAPAATPAPSEAREVHSGNYVTTRGVNGSYQTRELPPGVSYMQSIGGGGGGGPGPTPEPASADKVRSQWGWESKSALDPKPRH